MKMLTQDLTTADVLMISKDHVKDAEYFRSHCVRIDRYEDLGISGLRLDMSSWLEENSIK